MKKLIAGTRISVLDEDISGFVKQNNGGLVLIETTDGFEMTFHENELVIDEGIPEDRLVEGINKIDFSKKDSKPKKKKVVSAKKGVVPPMEVDLHIEQLVKSHKRLSNYQILNHQLDTAKHKIDFAIRKKIQRVVFIHGVGEGVLRAELEYLVRRYEDLKYFDADFQKYGRGAMEVYIPQSILKN